MAIWDDVVSEYDQQLSAKAGFNIRQEFGRSPALLIIDVVYNFVGDKPEPILKSMERFPVSCGEVGWKAIDQIKSLLPHARGRNIPVIYSTGDPALPKPWRATSLREEMYKTKIGNQIPKEIEPSANDIIIRKIAPSIFFGTPLASILFSFKVDTLFLCGVHTSGCVRASAVDAVSYGFRVFVIEECAFDRHEISHKVSLFDMNAKYATVVSVNEFKDYLESLSDQDRPAGL
jgi:nicotinamidase-related amidase